MSPYLDPMALPDLPLRRRLPCPLPHHRLDHLRPHLPWVPLGVFLHLFLESWVPLQTPSAPLPCLRIPSR